MEKVTVRIEGMACSMCEAHVSEALRGAFPEAKKVSASHTRGEATFLINAAPAEEAIRLALDGTGYKVLGASSEPFEKKGFSLFRRK